MPMTRTLPIALTGHTAYRRYVEAAAMTPRTRDERGVYGDEHCGGT